MRLEESRRKQHEMPERFFAARRLIHTTIMLLTAALAVMAWHKYQEQQTAWLAHEVNQPSAVLARHYARLLTQPMQTGDTQTIEQSMAFITQEPGVISAKIFDAQGKVLFSKQRETEISSPYDWPPVVHVADIVNRAKSVIGYVQINNDAARQLKRPYELAAMRFESAIMLAIIVFIGGAYCARIYYQLRPLLSKKLHQRSSSDK